MAEATSYPVSQRASSPMRSSSTSRIFKFKKRQTEEPNFYNACIIKIAPIESQNLNRMDMSQIAPYRGNNQFSSFDLGNGRQKNIEIGCYHLKMHCYDIVTLFQLQNDEQKYKFLANTFLHSSFNFLTINVLFYDATDQQSFMQIQKYFEILGRNIIVSTSIPLANLIVAKNSDLISRKKVSVGDALAVAQKHNALYIETGSNDQSEKFIEVAIALKAAQFGEQYLFSPFDSWRIALSSAQREISVPPNLTKIQEQWRGAMDKLLCSLQNLIGYTNMNPYIAHKELAIDLVRITKQLQRSSKQLQIINFSLKLIGNQKNFYKTQQSKNRKQVLTILKMNEEYENKTLKQQLKMKLELLKDKSKTHQPKQLAQVCQNFATDLFSCQQMFLNEQLGSLNENKDTNMQRKIGFKEREFKQKILTQLAMYKNSASHMQAAISELKNFEDKINESIKNADECLNGYNVLNILNMQPILNFVDFFIAKKSDEFHVDPEEYPQKSFKANNNKQYAYFLTQSEQAIKRNRFQCLDIVEELKRQFRQKDNKLMEIQILKHNLSIVKRNENVKSYQFKDFMANSKVLSESRIPSIKEFFDSASLKIGQLTNFKFGTESIIEEQNELSQKKSSKFQEPNNEMRNEFAEKIDGIASSIEQNAKIQYSKVAQKVNQVFSNTSRVVNENLDNLAANIDETANKIQRFADNRIKAGEEKVSQFQNKIQQNILNEPQQAQNQLRNSIQNITPNATSIKNSFSNKIEGVAEKVEDVVRGRKKIFTASPTSNPAPAYTTTYTTSPGPTYTTTYQTSTPDSAYTTTNTSVIENFIPNIDQTSIQKRVLKTVQDIQEGAIKIQKSLVDKMQGAVDTAKNIVTSQYQNGTSKIDEIKTNLNGKISNDFNYQRVTDKIEGLTSNISKEAVTQYERITSKLDKEKDEIQSSFSHGTKTFSQRVNNLGSIVQNGFEEKIVHTFNQQTSNLSKATHQIKYQIEESYSKIQSKVNHASNSVSHHDSSNHQVEHRNDYHNDHHDHDD